jgi:hypothetical protein
MKKILNLFIAALVCLVFNQTPAIASSHREAPLIAYDPLADNTDVYAFRSSVDTNNVVLIANYIPFEHPAGGPNYYQFGENIRYEIHIKNSAATTGDDITYRFTFRQENQDPTTFFKIRLGKENLKTTYTLERQIGAGAFVTIVTNGIVPPPNIGPRSIENPTVGLGTPYDTLMKNAIAMVPVTGEKVFAGQIDDPFFVDLGGIFDLGNVRNPGRDGLAKFNCHSLIIEVPISTLQKQGKTTAQATSILDADFVIGVWASASRLEITTFDTATARETGSGNWIQVSRLGMPLTNEVIIPIGQKDKWNSIVTNSAGEGQFAGFFSNPELALYMDDSQFGTAVPGLASLRIQTNSLGMFDFRNGKPGLFPVRGTPAVAGTAFAEPAAGGFAHLLLPDNMSPRAVDLLPIFLTGVPNVRPYQLATGKDGNPLAEGKPFVNNFLPTIGDMLRLNMAVPVTPRTINGQPNPDFSSLGLVQAAVLGLTDARFNGSKNLDFIPNMDGFPNGRRLEDDVTRIALQAVGGVVLAAIGLPYENETQLGATLGTMAGPTANDTMFRTVFPYVQGPWRGFNGEQYSGPESLQTLPVNYVSFTAEKVGQGALLQFEITNEANTDRYDVQYSVNGVDFTTIGTVKAKSGDKNKYDFLHSDPSAQRNNYYRLKQYDKEGQFTYSVIRLLRFNSSNVITITPNPASNFIRVYSKLPRLTVNLFDASGKRMASKVITNGSGEINISRLAKGTYLVVAENEGVRIETKRIIKH